MNTAERSLHQTVELLEVVASWLPEKDSLRRRLDALTDDVKTHQSRDRCPLCKKPPCEWLCPLWEARTPPEITHGAWPGPQIGNWEGGFTDATGRRWHHVPNKGWELSNQTPYLVLRVPRAPWWKWWRP
ncbi:hypothetical protein ACLQ2R_17425 [Streptosporangium sp. DT93]|uniref:hypothetical protein n=1 Tax=Streptosporangium sp. DT93 TaxID=3393428 RepID=UPI003CF958E5